MRKGEERQLKSCTLCTPALHPHTKHPSAFRQYDTRYSPLSAWQIHSWYASVNSNLDYCLASSSSHHTAHQLLDGLHLRGRPPRISACCLSYQPTSRPIDIFQAMSDHEGQAPEKKEDKRLSSPSDSDEDTVGHILPLVTRRRASP